MGPTGTAVLYGARTTTKSGQALHFSQGWEGEGEEGGVRGLAQETGLLNFPEMFEKRYQTKSRGDSFSVAEGLA